MTVVGYEFADGVTTITLSRPPANALGEPIIAGLARCGVRYGAAMRAAVPGRRDGA